MALKILESDPLVDIQDPSGTLNSAGRLVDPVWLAYIDSLLDKYTLNNKLLLLQTPQFLFEQLNVDIVKNGGFYAYPPASLQCLQRSLGHRNLEIDLMDLNFLLLKRIIEDASFKCEDWLEIVDQYLADNDPCIIGISGLCISTDVTNPEFHFTGLLQHLRNLDNHIIIAGGTIATNEYEYYLASGLCDFIVTGEGENKINYIFDHLYDRESQLAPMEGIYFRQHKKAVETSGQRDMVNVKGTLINTYKNIPIEEYNKVGSLNPFSRMSGQDKHFCTIQLNRGCRANCKFCGVPTFMGKGLRQYPVQDVVEEILYLVEERDVRHFEILDDDFLGTPSMRKPLKELLSEMVLIRNRYGITWSAGNGLIASSLNAEFLDLIRDSGCIGFRIGIESGNKDLLKKMRKPTTLRILYRLSATLQDYPEVFVGGNYIIGLFGEETFGQMMDTFKISCNINIDWSGFTVFQFTSKETAKSENLKVDGKQATDFIPTKDSGQRALSDTEEIVSGPEIFNLPVEEVPSREQIKYIWFAFNLLSNYINNKNLRPGGNHQKFVSWVDAVQISYPENPYMYLFSSLGHILLENKDRAGTNLAKCRSIVHASVKWKTDFHQFGLDKLMAQSPQKENEVFEVLEMVREPYMRYISIDPDHLPDTAFEDEILNNGF